MKKILRKLNVLLDKKQKRTMGWLVLLMILGAVLETASITLIFPVITVVINPESVETNKTVKMLYEGMHMQSTTQFAMVVMTALIIAFILKNSFLFLQQKATLHFVYTNQFRTSERMMRNYLKRSYEFYLNADTAVIQRNITSDVNNMYALILAVLQITSECIIFLTLGLTLFVMQPLMAVVIAVVLIVTLFVIMKRIKPTMKKAGQDNQDYYSRLFKWISQTVTGIKEVKITQKEQYFVDEYVICGHGYVDAVQKYSLYSATPRLLIETVCIMVMIGYLMVMMLSGQDLTNMVATIGVFGLAAVRLIPSANRINNQLTNMAYFEPFLMNVSDNLQDEISEDAVKAEFAKPDQQKLPVKNKIRVEDITYAYPNTDRLIFDHAGFEIRVGTSVGVVGPSGAGKSTVVDILLGLLEVQSGHIYADDTDIRSDYKGWLKNIGYIPQMIFMLDDTIRRNVAFGVPDDQIDEKRVWEVLKEAQLDEYIKSIPEGLDTTIGERGIRLSGGQRQRIGIARALYNDPEVLVLDEATSALDNDTEATIMDSINSLHGKKTLIIIAHRLQTIEKCDHVYRVENGKIEAER